jgi:hypothetical protein
MAQSAIIVGKRLDPVQQCSQYLRHLVAPNLL